MLPIFRSFVNIPTNVGLDDILFFGTLNHEERAKLHHFCETYVILLAHIAIFGQCSASGIPNLKNISQNR